MSVSGIGSAGAHTPNPLQAAIQQGRTDFLSLARTLTSGDLDGAQKAFSSLLKDILGIQAAVPSQGGAQAPARQANPLTDSLEALQKALDGGDLDAAQKAFAALVQALRGGQHGHHRHLQALSFSATISISASISTASAAATSSNDGSGSGQSLNVQI